MWARWNFTTSASSTAETTSHAGDDVTTAPGTGITSVELAPAETQLLLQKNQLTSAQEQWRQILTGQRPRATSPHGSRRTILTTANTRANFPWGDQLGPKAPTITRLYAINVNGISIDRRGGSFDDICRSVKEMQADIFCAQEHNLDTTQLSVRSALFETAEKHWTRNRLVMGTSPITFDNAYKPGGTLILTVDSLTGRVVKQDRDKWGRWVIQEFIGRGNRRLVLFSVYQPVDKTSQPGRVTVAAQQVSLLCLSQDPVKNPRRAFCRDLFKALKEYADDGASLLVLGDFNEKLGTDPDGITQIAGELELVDLMRSRHSSEPPATYARGSKCLDYALASPEVCYALKAAGYEEFNAHIASDHRGYFFDFETTLLFGSETQTLVTMAKRGLSANNASQVTEYIRQKHRILSEHNVFYRVQKLLNQGNRHEQAERIDKDVLEASLEAESKVTRFGDPAWSVELAQARRMVSILTKQLSALKTGYDHSDILTKALAELQNPIELPTNVSDCSIELRKAKAVVRDIVAESYQRRDHERRRKIEALEASQETADRKTALRLRRLKKAEDIKQLFRKLKMVRTKNNRRGVTRIETPLHPADDPKTCTEWTQIEVPTEILRLLQERNRHHFGQAQGTPFTVPPLSNELGFRGDGPIGDEILQGEYPVEYMNNNVKLLLKHLEQVHEMAEAPEYPTISDEEFSSKLRVWTESTTTSPSGIHLGHYKALIARHSFTTELFDDELTPEFKANRAELDSKQTDLRAVHLTLLNYALERGYSYRRWQTIANTILFKDDDNVRLHRTRVIHIYEADFNLALGIKWRAAMYQAEALKALNDGQFGSRPRRNATDPVFIEELQCEISRATRKPIVLTNYDATACYDRIIPSVGMLASRKFGVPYSVTQSNARTLEKAEYRVRTELGLAPSGYCHSAEHPIFGTGQGSANSPAIWCFLSSSLFDGYDEVATPAMYQSPCTQTTTCLGMVGFVDDCNGQTNQFLSDGSEKTLYQVLHQAQLNAQHWSDLLHASGGSLELSKCSCHVLHWIFSAQGAPVLAPKNSAHQQCLTVTDRVTDKEHTLELLSPYRAHKTLGHYKDPAGTQNEQFRRLKIKSDELTSFLWRVPLTRLETWTFYYACYLPSVGYPLSCSTLSRKRLDQVQRRAMSIIVPRCGFNRNTKREILYGPLELGGASFRHLYVQQGIGQVGLFIRNWRLQSIAGKLLRIAVGWFQQQVGTSYSILERVSVALPHLESKWLSSLREFLASIDCTLQLDNASIPVLQRHHDTHIMDSIIDSRKFTAAEIRRLNYCRLYLQAQTLSDLVDLNGNYLDKTKLDGKQSLLSSISHGVQINQGLPSERDWKLWQRANALWSDKDGNLYQPLGPWLVTTKQQRQRHASYWSNFVLWVRDGDYFIKCTQHPENKVVYCETTTKVTWENVPGDSCPVNITHESPHCWKVLTHGNISTTTLVKPPFPSTFDQYIFQLEPWESQLLASVDMPTDPFSVSVALSHGIRGVSDGSVWIKKLGAFGWTMSNDLGQRAAEGMGPAPGAKPNSYRSEAYGMLAMLSFLRRLAEFTSQYEPWTGIIATDSLSLIDTIRGVSRNEKECEVEDDRVLPGQPLDPLCPEWDLVNLIRQILETMPELQLQHVRGHQDRRVEYRNLPLLAQLNVDADDMANRFQREHGAERPFVMLTEGAGVHLVTPHGTITSKYASAIRYQATYAPLLNHIQTRNKWAPSTTERINWQAHGTSIRKQLKRRDHYIKLVQEILPTNHNVHRRDHSRRGCPACTHRDESWSHILQCSHPSRSAWREEMLRSLTEVCNKWATRPNLRDILLDGIKGWLASPDPDVYQLDDAIYDEEFQRLIKQQNNIGWKQVFLGRFSYEWCDMQEAFYVTRPNFNPKKRRKGAQWQVAIIACLWEQWYQLWTSRNGDLHGADTIQSAHIERQNALRTLRELYDLKNHYEPSAQDLLMADIRSHEAKSTWHIRNWISINEPVLRASFKHVKKKAIAGMRSLRSYWVPT